MKRLKLTGEKEVHVYRMNKQGRDFIIPDLHGAFALLERFMQDVAFDPTVDRMFSVGDLVDRGLESFKCLQLLCEDWFNATAANHEDMMIEFSRDCDKNGTGTENLHWIQNGGFWGYSLATEKSDDGFLFKDLVEIAAELPLMIVIETPAGKVALCHAEPNLSQLRHDGLSIEQFNNLEIPALNSALTTSHNYGDLSVLWSRKIGGIFYKSEMNEKNLQRVKRAITVSGVLKEIQGIMPMVTGHTIVTHPIKVHNWLFIDNAAWYADNNANEPTFAGLAVYNVTNDKLTKTNHLTGTVEIDFIDVMKENESDRLS